MNEKIIDLKDFIIILSKNIKKIFFIVLFFSVFGALISYLFNDVYKSQVTFIPQVPDSSSPSSGAISNLANIAGININESSSNYINPDLYPRIIQSIDFKNKLLNHKVNDTISLKDYLLNKNLNKINIYNPISLFNNIIYSDKKNDQVLINNNSNIEFISSQQKFLHDKLNSIIKINLNKFENVIELTTEMDDPLLSAIVAHKSKEILQEKIIDIKIKESKNKLESILENYQIKKKEFEIIQDKLATFKDKNQFISTETFSTELFKLDNEFNLKRLIFQELSTQVEKAKIEVTNNTPIFITIQKPSVPISRSFPKRKQFLFYGLLLGFFISVVYVSIKEKIIQKIIN